MQNFSYLFPRFVVLFAAMWHLGCSNFLLNPSCSFLVCSVELPAKSKPFFRPPRYAQSVILCVLLNSLVDEMWLKIKRNYVAETTNFFPY